MLLPFERQAITGDFKEFFKTKRNNFLATIQRFPRLWKIFQELDEIWLREIKDLHGLRETRQRVPALLFIHAHLKFRLAVEMIFSCCVAEAWGIARVGIESVAYAYKIYRQPKLAVVWLAKDDGNEERRRFKEAFEDRKKDSLFGAQQDLAKLYEYWRNFSDWGGHTTVATMATRFRQTNNASTIDWRLDYFETKETRIVTSVYTLIHAGWLMEHVFTEVFRTRFELDTTLVGMRKSFEAEHLGLARVIQRQYGEAIMADAEDTE